MAKGDDWLQEQIKDLTICFDEADTNKSGSLSMGELQEVLKKSGFTGTKREMNKIFYSMDQDADSLVTKEEFEKAIKNIPTASRREMALMKAFKVIDTNGSGTISKSELSVAGYMKNSGLSSQEINDLIKFVFQDDDKKIQYDEFLKVMNFKQSESTLNKLFSKLDKDGSGELSICEMREAINQEGDLARVRPQLLKVLDKTEKDTLERKVDFHRFVSIWMTGKDQILGEDFSSNPYI